jgi:hypothetical protein
MKKNGFILVGDIVERKLSSRERDFIQDYAEDYR